MLFTETPLKEAFTIELEKREDERGFFARLFCEEEFQKNGLESNFKQANNSLSIEKGTLRGLHYQLPPKAEVKLVRCVRGAVFDLILDLRLLSPTFGKWFGTELTENNRRMMYVPKGFAHGFLTLESDSELLYLVSESYSKEHERGIRWNDPQFNIRWPSEVNVISLRDQQHPNFSSHSETVDREVKQCEVNR